MKKIISALMSIILLMTLIPTSAMLFASAEDASTITLTPNDFTVVAVTSVGASGNSIISTNLQWPQFRIDLKNDYYIKSIKIDVTLACSSENGISLKANETLLKLCAADGAVVQKYGSWGVSYALGTKDYTYNVSEANQLTSISKIIYNNVSWSRVPTSGEATLTINSIEIDGVAVNATETKVLSYANGDYTLRATNSCSVSEDTVTSGAGTYFGFKILFTEKYYAKTVKITATVTNNSSNGATVRLCLYDGALRLCDENGSVIQKYGGWGQIFTSQEQSSCICTLSSGNYATPVASIDYGGGWSTASPEAGAYQVKIDNIEIQTFSAAESDAMVTGESITLENKRGCTITDNSFYSADAYPWFNIKTGTPVYADSIKLYITNGYTSEIGWNNSVVTLGFSDETKTKVSLQGAGWWKQTIPAATSEMTDEETIITPSTGVVEITVPKEYRTKKISYIYMEGCFISGSKGDGGPIAIQAVTYEDSPSSIAANIADELNNPITYASGLSKYNSVGLSIKLALADHCIIDAYEPVMTSAAVVDDASSAYYNRIQVTSSVPYIANNLSTVCYISEIGVIAIPNETLADAELTLDTSGIKKMYMTFEKGEDLSAYSEYSEALLVDEGFYNTEIAVRSYVKYTDGTNEIVYYSTNTDADNNITNGVATVVAPAIEENTQTVGDANCDGNIDIKDLIKLKKYFAGTITEINFTGADCNADGELTTQDLVTLRRYLLGIEELPQLPYSGGFVVEGDWSNLVDDSPDLADPVA